MTTEQKPLCVVQLIGRLRKNAYDHRHVACSQDMNPRDTVNWRHQLDDLAAAGALSALTAENATLRQQRDRLLELSKTHLKARDDAATAQAAFDNSADSEREATALVYAMLAASDADLDLRIRSACKRKTETQRDAGQQHFLHEVSPLTILGFWSHRRL